MLHSRERALQLLERWGNGNVELLNEVCELVPRIWEQVHSRWHSPEGLPGVFEYEVVSPLGEQLAEHLLSSGSLPSRGEVDVMIGRLLANFFSPEATALPGAEEDDGNETITLAETRRLWMQNLLRSIGRG